MSINFYSLEISPPRIEPEYTVAVADTLFTQPLIISVAALLTLCMRSVKLQRSHKLKLVIKLQAGE